jgi:enterochelin esterase-like enzyme
MRIELKAPSWATHFLSDLTDWKKSPTPVSAMQPFDLPDDVYFEYAYRDEQGQNRPDPENPNPVLNPWWDYASNLTGPDYRPHPLANISGVGPAGQVLRMKLESRVLNQTRRILIYSPPGMGTAALPHILFQDGKAFFGWGKAPQVLDRLLAEGRVGAAHLIFVPPVHRTSEYAFNGEYRRFLLEELLPFVEDRVACDGRRAAWGASLGGLLSAQLGWQRPDLFQKVVSQSGAFLFSEDMDFSHPFAGNESFVKEVLGSPPRDLRWHLDCGRLEWLLESNRNLASALAGRGMPVRLLERNAGHNWINWRNGLAEGLEFVLHDWHSPSPQKAP